VICGNISAARKGMLNRGKDSRSMAKCENCGKVTTFGRNRSFSMKATRRTFKPNLHKVKVIEGGRQVQKVLCSKCLKRTAKV